MDNKQEYAKAIQYIESRIEAGQLTIGSKLPAERDIAEKLGIGRNSTREALSILGGMGVITRKHGSGNYITGETSEAIGQMVNIMLALGGVSKGEICMFRRIMEKAVCMNLIETGVDDETSSTLSELVKNMKNVEQRSEVDKKFHYELIKATDNRLLMMLMEAVINVYGQLIDLVIAKADEDKQQKLLECHERIYQGIVARNVASVMGAIDEHYNIIEDTV